MILEAFIRNSDKKRFLRIHEGLRVLFSNRVVITVIVFLAVLLGSFYACVIYDAMFYYYIVIISAIVCVLALFQFEAAFLFVPFCLTNPIILSQTQTRLRISELVFLIIFSVWLVRLIVTKEKILFPKIFLIPVIVIISAAIVSFFAAPHSNKTGMQQLVRYMEVLIAFFMVVFYCGRKEQYIKKIFLYLMIGGLCASLVGIIQFIIKSLDSGVAERIFGLHGGSYGAIIGSTLVLAFSALSYPVEKNTRLWAIVTMPFSGLALILSQTRAWIGALFIVVLFLLIWTKHSSLKKILLIMGIMMGIVFLVGMINLLGVIDMKYFMKAFEGAFRYGSGEKHSTQDLAIYMRLNVWRMAIQHFLEHPFFGIGIGNLRFSNYLTGQLGNPIEGMGYVDNQYIQAFTETGIVGGIAWIVLMYRSIRIGLQSMSKSVGSMLQAPATGFLGSFLIFAIGSLFWVVTPQHESFALMVLYSGMLFNIDTLRDGNMKRGENS